MGKKNLFGKLKDKLNKGKAQEEVEEEEEYEEVEYEEGEEGEEDVEYEEVEYEEEEEVEIPQTAAQPSEEEEEHEEVEYEEEEEEDELPLQEMPKASNEEEVEEEEYEEEEYEEEEYEEEEYEEEGVPVAAAGAAVAVAGAAAKAGKIKLGGGGGQGPGGGGGDGPSGGDSGTPLAPLFGIESRSTIHKVFVVLFMFSFSYSLGKIGAIIVDKQILAKKKRGKKGPSGAFTSARIRRAGQNVDHIKGRNLFNVYPPKPKKVVVGKPKPKIKKILVCDDSKKARRKTSLPVKLLTTFVLQNPAKSIASIKYRGKVKAIRVGDKLDNKAEVTIIENQNVVIKNIRANKCEHITNKDKRLERKFKKLMPKVMSPSAGKRAMAAKKFKGISQEGNRFKIKKTLRNEMLKDINNVLQQARGIQINNPDGTLAFKVVDVVPGSIYSALNIEDGDVITGINGKKIENLNEIMNLFGKIRDVDNLSLTISRDGEEQTKDYNFE